MKLSKSVFLAACLALSTISFDGPAAAQDQDRDRVQDRLQDQTPDQDRTRLQDRDQTPDRDRTRDRLSDGTGTLSSGTAAGAGTQNQNRGQS